MVQKTIIVGLAGAQLDSYRGKKKTNEYSIPQKEACY